MSTIDTTPASTTPVDSAEAHEQVMLTASAAWPRAAEAAVEVARHMLRELETLRGALARIEQRLETVDLPQPPTPPSPPAPPVGPDVSAEHRARAGVNLAPVDDWSTARPWRNLTRAMRQWLGSDWQAWRGPLTADGYPARLNPGEFVRGLIEWDVPAEARTTGRVRLSWQGRGTVQLTAGGRESQFTRREGQLECLLAAGSASGGIELRITDTDPADPVRGLWLGSVEADLAGAGRDAWNPALLARLAPFGTLRLMDWSRTNEARAARWAERRRPDAATQAGTLGPSAAGVAWEWCCDVARATHATPWLCLPYLADREYCRELGALCAERLGAGSSVYLEYSNELWNHQFAAARDVWARSGAGGWWQVIADDARQRFAWFNETFPRERTRRVLACQAANVWLGEQLAALTPAADWDVLAPAGYFNYRDYSSVERLLASAEDSLSRETLPWLEAHAALARKHGKQLALYEAGPHQGAGLTSEALPVVAAAHRDARMGALMTRLWEKCIELNVGPVCWYYDVGKPHASGVWGLLEYQEQEPTTAVKYLAASGALVPSGVAAREAVAAATGASAGGGVA